LVLLEIARGGGLVGEGVERDGGERSGEKSSHPEGLCKGSGSAESMPDMRGISSVVGTW
jgi:hypothetical protein